MATRRRLSKHEADATLAGANWILAIRSLPDDVDVTLAVPRVLELLDAQPPAFALNCASLPGAVIDACVVAMKEAPTSAWRVLVLELTRSQVPWSEIATIVRSLNRRYAWGSKSMREIITGLASRPAVMAAIQAAVVSDLEVHHTLLGVLAADGNDASIDALMPIFSRDTSESMLEHLRTHATKSDALEAMFETVAERTRNRQQRHPATLAVSKIVGAALAAAKISVVLNSVEHGALGALGAPRIQGVLRIDSEGEQIWRIDVLRESGAEGSTVINATGVVIDELQLGACTFEDVPTWLKRAERSLGIHFRVSQPRGSLRGEHRHAFRDWLFSLPAKAP